MRRERILLCKPKMCGREIDFIKAALAEDWTVPLGPDCDASVSSNILSDRIKK